MCMQIFRVKLHVKFKKRKTVPFEVQYYSNAEVDICLPTRSSSDKAYIFPS